MDTPSDSYPDDGTGFLADPPPTEDSTIHIITAPPGDETQDSPAPPDPEAPPPESESESESSPPPPSEQESPPPAASSTTPPVSSPPTSSPPPTTTTPVSSPPPPSKSSSSPPPPNSPPSSTPSSSPPPPPPSGGGPSPPSSSPPPPSANSSSPPSPAASSTTPVTPASPGVFSPPPSTLVPGASGRPLPSPSQPRGTPATPAARSPAPPSSDSSSSNNTVLIAGIALAGVLVIAFIGIWLICSKKKKKQPHYMDPGRTPKGNDPYYNGSANWNSPNPMDHVVKVPPPPGVMGTPVTPGAGWAVPPLPPLVNTSSEFSSGFSGNNQTSASPNMGLGAFKSQFSFEELAAATSGFSQANLLGQGGFGYVHKGVLSDGRTVAVKSLKSGSGQGEREFQAEVDIISRVHHRHLVSLVGYCIADGQRMLVYEFVANKTLEFHLHGKGQPVMEWEFRLRIALGSAKGLAYLHEDCHPKIIHRDIKTANILLDDKYEAMVADFGLAKLSSDNHTHVSTRVMGTFGYLAPEYASSGKLTEKSDVFSFGVMLLELITGKRPVDPNDRYMEDSLVDWARPVLTKSLEDGYYTEIADPRLEGNYVPHEMARMVACASASIRHSARRRPKMSQIVRALEGDSSLDDLSNGPIKQHQSGAFGSGGSGAGDTQIYDTGMYNADMSKFRKMVMNSQEFNSSEFGATSDYGLNPSSSSSDSRESAPEQHKPHP